LDDRLLWLLLLEDDALLWLDTLELLALDKLLSEL